VGHTSLPSDNERPRASRPPSQGAARRKAKTRRTDNGAPVHSFQSLLSTSQFVGTPIPACGEKAGGEGACGKPERQSSAHSRTLRRVESPPHPARKSAPTSPYERY
jgi:hypothetical protein